MEKTRKKDTWSLTGKLKKRRKKITRRLWLKEGVSILFRLRPLIFLVRERIRKVVVILGVIFGMKLVVRLTVIL